MAMLQNVNNKNNNNQSDECQNKGTAGWNDGVNISWFTQYITGHFIRS